MTCPFIKYQTSSHHLPGPAPLPRGSWQKKNMSAFCPLPNVCLSCSDTEIEAVWPCPEAQFTQLGSLRVRKKKRKKKGGGGKSCNITGVSCLKSEVAAKTSFRFYMKAEFRYQNLWHCSGLVLRKLGFKTPVLNSQRHDIVAACYVQGRGGGGVV